MLHQLHRDVIGFLSAYPGDPEINAIALYGLAAVAAAIFATR
jgi:hypothetical protein